MSELWSAQQHQWLAALGHTLYVPGSAEAPLQAETAPARQAESTAATAPVAAAPRRGPVPETPAPAARATGNLGRNASRLPDKLHFALIRASGCNPNAEEAAEIIARWPPSAELRGNPAAKRALWPQLRALRRPRLP